MRMRVAKICPRLIRPYPLNKSKIVRSRGGLNKQGLLYFKVQAHKQKEHLNLRFSSTRQGENCECHPENSFLFIIWAAIRFYFINQPWALYIACDKCCNIYDLVAVKSLYITWLIHKEQLYIKGIFLWTFLRPTFSNISGKLQWRHSNCQGKKSWAKTCVGQDRLL